eukprot:Plantae.Rhodophyta-Purpureofilum_apyrenoidigerum.ctg27576.p1 GENE.Plantae.Rhodophyta-Purpureofilum_apyrenoidigerum.ctg27576~~Plantae.Rhodophyta-Purpureofilum_apyrenoidigerum.ctg27576.p1  ORF type:complete len:147 (-),score=30.35 Plantae.Rhodophyta-Purpureofilum_apyrenoidigerum.ctg27576:7-447(-)
MVSMDEVLQEVLDAARAGDAADIRTTLEPLNAAEKQEVVEKMNMPGTRPLHYASANGHAGVAEMLLKCGACASVRNDYGNTPLHFAALNGHDLVVSILLKNGADPAALNGFGRSAYDEAASKNHVGVKKILMDYAESNPATDAPEE